MTMSSIDSLFDDTNSFRVLGICGGIASGKSTIRAAFKEIGATVIDADKIGHAVYPFVYEKLADAFGEDVMEGSKADGGYTGVKRGALGPIVFGSKSEMQKLNDIMWPEIRIRIQQSLKERKNEGTTSMVVVEAAVLFEAGWEDLFDHIIVSAVDRDIAKIRLTERNKISEQDAVTRIDAQANNESRIAKADFVIWNNGTVEDLTKEVVKVHTAIQKMN